MKNTGALLADQHNTEEHLGCAVNQAQRHCCTSTQYYLRRNKTTGQTDCRMGFLHQTRMEQVLAKPLDATYYRPRPDLHGAHLNPYNLVVSMVWLANVVVPFLLPLHMDPLTFLLPLLPVVDKRLRWQATEKIIVKVSVRTAPILASNPYSPPHLTAY